MFVATAVFLTGLLFVVQQALVIYSSLDMSTPFQAKDSYTVNNIIDLVNYTIISQEDTADPIADCVDFENNLIELMSSVRDDLSREGYLLMSDYSLDCGYWNNNPPMPAPLKLTISYTGDLESFGTFIFYHTGIFVPPPDLTGPSVSNTQNSPGSPTSADDITITADISDAESNILSCELRVVGVSGWQAMDADDGSYDSQSESVNLDIGNLPDGTYTIEVRCWDAAANPTSPIATQSVTVSAPGAIAISTCVELQNMQSDLTADYYLTQNIDCYADTRAGGALWNGGQGFNPVGLFSGTLDGNGYTIDGLHISRPATNNVGLFSDNSVASEIKDVGLIDVNITGNQNVGALAGVLDGNISSSSSTGNISGGNNVGGLVGFGNGIVRNSYSIANVTGSWYTGGLVGNTNVGAYIEGSYFIGNVVGTNNIGGLVGYNRANIDRSYSSGNVSQSVFIGSAGGLIGQITQPVTITDSYSVADVYGDNAGGFIGSIGGALPVVIIINSFSAGDVSGGVSVGGFMSGGVATCNDCFWDTDTSGQAASACGTGLTTAQMTQQATFVPPWNFTSNWQIDGGTSYPCLQWQGGVGSCYVP